MTDNLIVFSSFGLVICVGGILTMMWANKKLYNEVRKCAEALRAIATQNLKTGNIYENYRNLVSTEDKEKLVVNIIKQNLSMQAIASKALNCKELDCEEEEISLRKKYLALHPFRQGQKVGYEGKVYDFGYISGMGYAILYEEGECNMQDSIAVNPWEVKKL